MPVLDPDAAREFIQRRQREGGRVAFTEGAFDLLHPGHVRYLRAARATADALVVGIHADDIVRRAHGPGRPINPAGERAEIVAALDDVDAAVIVDDSASPALVTALQPDVLVTEANDAGRAIPGRDLVEARGGRVVVLAAEHGWSTTSIIEQIQRQTRS